MHQLRKHMAFLGYPILGDGKYKYRRKEDIRVQGVEVVEEHLAPVEQYSLQMKEQQQQQEGQWQQQQQQQRGQPQQREGQGEQQQQQQQGHQQPEGQELQQQQQQQEGQEQKQQQEQQETQQKQSLLHVAAAAAAAAVAAPLKHQLHASASELELEHKRLRAAIPVMNAMTRRGAVSKGALEAASRASGAGEIFLTAEDAVAATAVKEAAAGAGGGNESSREAVVTVAGSTGEAFGSIAAPGEGLEEGDDEGLGEVMSGSEEEMEEVVKVAGSSAGNGGLDEEEDGQETLSDGSRVAMCLWAVQLQFVHPATKEVMDVSIGHASEVYEGVFRTEQQWLQN